MEMPGRTRGETRAMRDAVQEYAHRHGVLSTMGPAALVSMLATHESINKIVRQHSAPKNSPDLPTAHIPYISEPSSVSDVEESPHVDWRHPMIGKCNLGISLEVFADADYASRATNRRSVSGGAIMYVGACVCWFSRTQKCVTLSISEAEYVALSDAVKELLFLRQVWRFMISGKGMPCFPVFEDNQGALQLSKNPVSNSNSKNIDVRHHFLRELVCQGDTIVNHVPSEYQHADMLTEVLAFDLFAIHRRFSMNLSD